jgi:hypothetical protein
MGEVKRVGQICLPLRADFLFEPLEAVAEVTARPGWVAGLDPGLAELQERSCDPRPAPTLGGMIAEALLLVGRSALDVVDHVGVPTRLL